MNQRIITFEGIDGAGKSTLVKSLRDHFTAKGRSVLYTWEPWSASEIDPDPFIATMQLMIDRRRHCAMIRELSDRYDLVLIDRFDLSTVAYQGYGDGVDLGLIQRLNDIAIEGIEVTRRIWLDIPVGIAVERLRDRGEQVEEGEIARLVRVSSGYKVTYQHGLMRMRCIQASQPADAVLREAINRIEEVL